METWAKKHSRHFEMNSSKHHIEKILKSIKNSFGSHNTVAFFDFNCSTAKQVMTRQTFSMNNQNKCVLPCCQPLPLTGFKLITVSQKPEANPGQRQTSLSCIFYFLLFCVRATSFVASQTWPSFLCHFKRQPGMVARNKTRALAKKKKHKKSLSAAPCDELHG